MMEGAGGAKCAEMSMSMSAPSHTSVTTCFSQKHQSMSPMNNLNHITIRKSCSIAINLLAYVTPTSGNY